MHVGRRPARGALFAASLALACGGSSRGYGVWGSASDDVWAVGYAGTILHWDGTLCSMVPSTTTAPLDAVWGSGPRSAFAVGQDGTILGWSP
jgi:hypothetical protein